MRVVTVVGARPQFIKAAPLSSALRIKHHEVLVHTGQHYDDYLSKVFFEELNLPKPDYDLGVGSGPHGAQTGAMLSALEPVLVSAKPDLVIVYGDTNSTLAAALAAAKLNLRIGHVEAGLRSYNRRMPEEINRLVADHLSTWLFAPSEEAVRQLSEEGITQGVHVVGDIMCDAVRIHGERARLVSRYPGAMGLEDGKYFVATIHRAENADDADRLRGIVDGLGGLQLPVILPLHPRTRRALQRFRIEVPAAIMVVDPIGYLDMLALVARSKCVLTDSGGLQKEAYYLGVRCVTLRDETEWTETVATGWNVLAGAEGARILDAVAMQSGRSGIRPALYGDGRAAERIARVLESS